MQQADGEDELKKRQLMELAIINGTYRDSSAKAAVATGIEYHLGTMIIWMITIDIKISMIFQQFH